MDQILPEVFGTSKHSFYIKVYILNDYNVLWFENVKLLLQILKRGAHINDRDGLTDMTLLHYASKSGAAGIGDPEVAAKVVLMLISKGSDVNIRCRWTNMTSLHYSAYFDVVPVIKVLLKATKAIGKIHCVMHW